MTPFPPAVAGGIVDEIRALRRHARARLGFLDQLVPFVVGVADHPAQAVGQTRAVAGGVVAVSERHRGRTGSTRIVHAGDATGIVVGGGL